MKNPQELFARAKKALSTGQSETARKILQQLLEAYPDSAETLFHLGRLELMEGNVKKAHKLLMRSLKLRPQEPAIWNLLMDLEIKRRDKKAIAQLLSAAKRARLPKNALRQLANKASTGNRQGVAHVVGITAEEFERARGAYMAGRFKEAEQLATQLIRKSPKSAPLHAIRAAALAQQGEVAMARKSYEKALQIDPEYAEAHLQLGQLLTGINDYTQANTHLSRALELASESPMAHLSMGILQTKLKNDKKAIEHLEIARESLPKEPRLWLSLAQALQGEARAEEAAQALQKARALPLGPAEKIELTRTLMDLGELDEAQELLQKLRKASPDNPELLSLEASLATYRGDSDAMREAIRELVALGKAGGGQLLNYARGSKIDRDDPVVREMVRAFKRDGEDPGVRSGLAFALAKVHDDWGEYRKSFKYLRQANDIARSMSPPDKQGRLDNFDLARRSYERSRPGWPDRGQAGHDGLPRSIQITGMPRSGTTLVEQIISSHSRVTPGGEIGIVGNQFQPRLDLLDIEDKPLPADELAPLGRSVSEAYHALFPEAEIVTDKAILSNVWTGIFCHALPGDRMIVLRRDPRDNCLSIYKNRFQTGAHTYSTDLESLARTYLSFLEVQRYWQEHEPGSFLEVSYEALTENPEEEARRLIDYCGLEWEDACLEFYKSKRQVKTLSAFQVRQKIYSSSVGAWKHYEEELQPLIRILDEGGALEGY